MERQQSKKESNARSRMAARTRDNPRPWLSLLSAPAGLSPRSRRSLASSSRLLRRTARSKSASYDASCAVPACRRAFSRCSSSCVRPWLLVRRKISRKGLAEREPGREAGREDGREECVGEAAVVGSSCSVV